MDNNDEFSNFLTRVDAKGLKLIDDSSNAPGVITSLERVIPNGHYQLVHKCKPLSRNN